MANPIVTTKTLIAGVANGIALSQTPGSANLTLNGSLVSGGVATFDAPRRVIVTSGGNDSGISFVFTGTGRASGTNQPGPALVETVAGTNGGVSQTTQDFLTITQIAPTGAISGSGVTAGTNGTGSGPWVPWDQNVQTRFQVSVVGQVLSGAPTWQLDYTYDDVYGTWLPSNVTWPRPLAWANLTGKTGTADDVILQPVRATRLTLTAIGSVQLTQLSQGN